MNKGSITKYQSTTYRFDVRPTTGEPKPKVTGSLEVWYFPPIMNMPRLIHIRRLGQILLEINNNDRRFAESQKAAAEILRQYQAGILPQPASQDPPPAPQ